MSSEKGKKERKKGSGGAREGAGHPSALKGFNGTPTKPKESLKAQWEALIYERTLENLEALYNLANLTDDENLEARIRIALLDKAVPTAQKIEQQIDTEVRICVVYEDNNDQDSLEASSGTDEGGEEQSEV